MHFTNNKLCCLLCIITLSTTQLGAMTSAETDRAVKQVQQSHITRDTPSSPIPRIRGITVQPAKKPTPRRACCGKGLRKIARACDQCIKYQKACCAWCSDYQADRMEQKMAAEDNYLPARCCLTCINLAGRCCEEGLTLCADCLKALAACCNGNDLTTEITEELQETREEQELKLAVQEEVIKEIKRNLQEIEVAIREDVLKVLLHNPHTCRLLRILHLQLRTHYTQYISTQKEELEQMQTNHQETLAAIEENKKKQ
jgi:hypothetical protein